MNPLKMIHDLHDELNKEFDRTISQIDALEKITDEYAPLHISLLTEKSDTLVNRIYLLDKAIKKYTRLSMTYSDDTFLGLIERLATDKRFVAAQGKDAELMRLASEKIQQELYEIHEYEDGSIDPVILNWESAEMMRANEETR